MYIGIILFLHEIFIICTGKYKWFFLFLLFQSINSEPDKKFYLYNKLWLFENTYVSLLWLHS